MAKKDITKVTNVTKPTPPKSDITHTIKQKVQLFRSRQDIQKWRQALTAAENIYNPQRYLLYLLYQEIVLDAHLTAAIQQRKNLILCKDYEVAKPDGTIDEEKTALIRKKWFRDFLDLALDAIYYGHSLIQFEDLINDEFKCVELVPRIYVKPELHIVTENWTAMTGQDYLDNPFKEWVISVGKSHDLGLLMKAAPLVLWKKNALGAWSEFIEIFGAPIRIGKTNTRDEGTRKNMEDMLKNMGVAAYGVFDTDDLIELIESNRTDSYQVFDMMIQRCNSEISKLILGQTATMDEKSFVGSAEVQERVLDNVSDSDEYFIDGVLNYQLIPLMNGLGMGFEGLVIRSEGEDEFTLDQKAKFDIELIKTGIYKMTPEYIKEKYSTEVVEVEQPVDTGLQKVKNALEKYYS